VFVVQPFYTLYFEHSLLAEMYLIYTTFRSMALLSFQFSCCLYPGIFLISLILVATIGMWFGTS